MAHKDILIREGLLIAELSESLAKVFRDEIDPRGITEEWWVERAHNLVIELSGKLVIMPKYVYDEFTLAARRALSEAKKATPSDASPPENPSK